MGYWDEKTTTVKGLEGNNTFIFNHATMVNAMQLYVDSILDERGKVEVVSVKEEQAAHQCKVFHVEVKEPEKQQPTDG